MEPTDPNEPAPLVRGLALPPLLVSYLTSARWQHPGDQVLHEVLPWFEDPLVFLSTTEAMEQESRSLDLEADDDRSSRFFHLIRGSHTGSLWLPWLDVELAFLLAVNRRPGDDVGIALDYRRETGEPAVVASDVWTYPPCYLWRPVAPSFEVFANMLGIGS
jgi:hypothetical protein